MRSCCLLLLLAATCASAFVAVAPPSGAVVARTSAVFTPAVTMTSANKQAKAAKQKVKTSKAARKRFKVTASGKLLRHYAGKAHLLRKKRPQSKAALRRTGQCDTAELDTYQMLLNVHPKKGTATRP